MERVCRFYILDFAEYNGGLSFFMVVSSVLAASSFNRRAAVFGDMTYLQRDWLFSAD
ncbi:hypothetical protein [Bacillus sp. SA1-12]|uniref:hypothetical protein n=1 Tax=Bacillus sp. SA1-12 TaxID=1455638 RepID=UPI000B248EB9|nr:hypothetical protein [Bacillus sp. SA1-12]